MAPRLGVGACALDAAVHAWDIAVATGQPSPLTPDLARTLMTVATNIVEPLRGYGVYAPALTVSGHADVLQHDVGLGTAAGFDAGRIVEKGRPEAVFTEPTEERTRVFLKRILAPGRL